MNLSIITPAAPRRFDRIEMIFKRLELNAARHPSITFEFVIVDDSLNQEYLELSQRQWNFPVKYINLPLTEQYPNPAYVRNVGFRIAEGEIFTMIDADHWVHEDFIEGAIACPDKLNTGYMIDTSKGSNFQNIHEIEKANQKLIAQAEGLSFSECMQITGLNGPKAWNKVWLASYPAEVLLSINGYDEKYVAGYSREDDDIYYRLSNCVPIDNGHYETFCGVHLWHPQAARQEAKNVLNRNYYNSADPSDTVRNLNHEWGKFVQGSFSIINGKKMEYDEHEEYVAKLIRVSPYISDPWINFQALVETVDKTTE